MNYHSKYLYYIGWETETYSSVVITYSGTSDKGPFKIFIGRASPQWILLNSVIYYKSDILFEPPRLGRPLYKGLRYWPHSVLCFRDSIYYTLTSDAAPSLSVIRCLLLSVPSYP